MKSYIPVNTITKKSCPKFLFNWPTLGTPDLLESGEYFTENLDQVGNKLFFIIEEA